MNKWLVILAAIVIVFVLIRGGYLGGENNSTNNEDSAMMEEKTDGDNMMESERMDDGAMMEKEDEGGEAMMKKEEVEEAMVMTDGSLSLSAEAQGDNKVSFTWSAPESLDESNRFIIVRGEETNPEHTQLNYWIRQSHLKRDVVWNDVPEGTWHFRVCLTENDDKDTCTKYSNSVEVTVN